MSNLMNRTPREEIEKLAVTKLQQYGVDTLPIDPLVIAKNNKIQVMNAEFHDASISGMISKQDKQVTIYIKNNDVPTRKKFTIAHELGHFFLHLSNQEEGDFVDRARSKILLSSTSDYNEDDRNKEIEANQFAAALLMPENEVIKHLSDCGSIDELARRFGVSVSAMENRLLNLGWIV